MWKSGEIAAGVIISCLPVLPRLIRTCAPRTRSAFAPRTRSAFASEIKMGQGMTSASGTRENRRGEDALNDWHELRTQTSDQYPSLNEQGRKQDECASKKGSSQASLVPDPGPTVLSLREPLPGQILMTTYIETRTEERQVSDRVWREDLERQQLRW